jgi:hypothetical protein
MLGVRGGYVWSNYMLSRDEQTFIIKQVQSVIKTIQSHQARVKRKEMTPASAKNAYKRAIDKLRDHLKEVG